VPRPWRRTRKVLGRHLVQRLAHGAGADPEIGGDVGLARQDLARLPGPGRKTADQHVLHLAVQRPEAERGWRRSASRLRGPVHPVP
jgi:hypothetical protein